MHFVEDGTLDFTNVSDAALDGGRIDEALYGVNLGTNSLSFVFDLDAFEAAGIEVPARIGPGKISRRPSWRSPKRPAAGALADGLSNEQVWKSLYLSNGEWAYNDDGTALGYDDDSLFANYIDMILRLQDAGAIPTYEEARRRSGR